MSTDPVDAALQSAHEAKAAGGIPWVSKTRILQTGVPEAWERPVMKADLVRVEASERFQEIADELQRRGLVIEHTQYAVVAVVGDGLTLQVDAGVDDKQPYVVGVYNDRGVNLIPRQSASFEGALRTIDIFLAGYRAAR